MNVQTSKSSFIKRLTSGSEKPSTVCKSIDYQKKLSEVIHDISWRFWSFLAYRQTNTHKYRQKDEPKGPTSCMNANKNDFMLHNMIPLIENRFCPTFFRFRWKKNSVGGKVWLSSEIMQQLISRKNNFNGCINKFNGCFLTQSIWLFMFGAKLCVRVTDVALYLACILLWLQSSNTFYDVN